MSTPVKKYKFNVISKKSDNSSCHDFGDFLHEMGDWEWDYRDVGTFLRSLAPLMPEDIFEKNTLTISFCEDGDASDPDSDEYIFTITRSK